MLCSSCSRNAMVLAFGASSASPCPCPRPRPRSRPSLLLPYRLRFSSLNVRPFFCDRRALLLSFRNKENSAVRAGRRSRFPVKCDIAGQYEESFSDVDKHLLDYFTFKAVRTVLVQLYEMNPTQYIWFYRFVADNKPQDSKLFLRVLVKERQELAERVMVTRLHLYNLWIKKYDHASMYQAISDQNLELLRERLVQTVKWPSTDEEKQQT